jgi:hypothetical protein
MNSSSQKEEEKLHRIQTIHSCPKKLYHTATRRADSLVFLQYLTLYVLYDSLKQENDVIKENS